MTHSSPAMACATRARKSSRSAIFQPLSQKSASSSTCGTLRSGPSARAKVVLPLPVVPTTETRLTERDDILGPTPVKLHEYQAKQLLARSGIPIPEGRLATTHEEAEAAARALGGTVVVKAQVHAGGRGKAGGIKVAKTPAEAREHASTILHMQIKGLRVRKVLVERGAQIASELYLGITLDRDRRRPVVMLSTVGGMDIEEVAEKEPEKIARGWPDPLVGLLPYQARALCFDAGVPAAQRNAVADIAIKLYGIYARTDAMLVEINPLFIQSDGSVLAGDVGIIGNGAGLVMGTLDAVRNAGGRAANFLDVGGGAKESVVRSALEIVLANPKVKSVLINIFGGITRGDEVAKGILDVLHTHPPSVPLVIRLSGTEAEAGRKLLAGAKLVSKATMDDAAKEAVVLAGSA